MTTATTTYTEQTQQDLDEIWFRWREEQQRAIDNGEPIQNGFPLPDDDPDPFFVHLRCGAYKLHYPNEPCPDLDVLDNLKQLGKDKSCIKWKADLCHWMDVFAHLVPKLGLGDSDRGIDLGIYLAYRVGGWTRKQLCEDLQETDAEVQNSIKKSERLIKKHIDQVRWHYLKSSVELRTAESASVAATDHISNGFQLTCLFAINFGTLFTIFKIQKILLFYTFAEIHCAARELKCMIREKVFHLTHHKPMTKRTPTYSLGYTLDDELQVIQEVRAYTEHNNKEDAYMDLLYQCLQPSIDKFKSTYKSSWSPLGLVLNHHDYTSTRSDERTKQVAQ